MKSTRRVRELRRLTLERLEERWLLFANGPHQEITLAGLSFLNEEFLDEIQDRHLAQDILSQLHQPAHFDGSHLLEGSKLINQWYSEILVAASPKNFDAEEIAELFGNILHAAQDFYSHTNWVELLEAGYHLGGDLSQPIAGTNLLVDAGLEFWQEMTPYSERNGLLFVQGEDETPFGQNSLRRAANSKIVTVHVGGGQSVPSGIYGGVISGSVNPVFYGGDDVPDNVALSHGGILAGDFTLAGPSLAKDDPEDPFHTEARQLAIAQTAHEFKRLTHLIFKNYGPYGVEKLLDSWVDPVYQPAVRSNLVDQFNPDDPLFFVVPQSPPQYTSATIITHGFQDAGGDYLMPLAAAIRQRADGANGISEAAWLLDLDVDDEGTTYVDVAQSILPTPNDSGHLVVLFDWAEGSNTPSMGWGEAAGDALFNLLVGLELVNPTDGTVAGPLHFIAHSSGSAVTSEAIERLAAWDVPVDQVTYLDPHDFDQSNPSSGGAQPLDGLGRPQLSGDGYGATIWNNVDFADVYYQTESAHGGRPIPGAFNVNVTDDPQVALPDSVWKSFYLNTVTDATSTTGYAFSSIAGGDTPNGLRSNALGNFYDLSQNHKFTSTDLLAKFAVHYEDPILTTQYPLLKANVDSAIRALAALLSGNGIIDVEVRSTNDQQVTPNAKGEVGFWTFSAGVSESLIPNAVVLESGPFYELRTGIDPNGASDADIVITLNTDWLDNHVWFAPEFDAGTASVPSDRFDIRTVIQHELIHGLGFSGFRRRDADPSQYGTFPTLVDVGLTIPGVDPSSEVGSAFDFLTAADSSTGSLLFSGSTALAANLGEPIPLVSVGVVDLSHEFLGASFYHVGNPEGLGLPGGELLVDLMSTDLEKRKGVSPSVSNIDWGMLVDVAGVFGLTLQRDLYRSNDINNARWSPEWQPLSIVNGDFQLTGHQFTSMPSLADNRVPGWSQHGGGGSAIVALESPGNFALRLSSSGNARTHNDLFVPVDAGVLTFRARVSGAATGRLLVSLGDERLASIDVNSEFTVDWTEIVLSVPVESLGSTASVTISLENGAPNTAVYVDDFKFQRGGRTGDLIPLDLGSMWATGTPDSSRLQAQILVEGIGEVDLDVVTSGATGQRLELFRDGDYYGALLFDHELPNAGYNVYFLPSGDNALAFDADLNATGFQGIVQFTLDGDASSAMDVAIYPGHYLQGRGAILVNAVGAPAYDLSFRESLALQQRLRFFGFPDSSGNPISLDGIVGPETTHALRVFKNTIGGSTGSIEEISELNARTVAWLNAENAPRWTALPHPSSADGYRVATAVRIDFGASTARMRLAFGGETTASFDRTSPAAELELALNTLTASTADGKFEVLRETSGNLVVYLNGDLAERRSELKLEPDNSTLGLGGARLVNVVVPSFGSDWLIDTLTKGLALFSAHSTLMPTIRKISRTDGDPLIDDFRDGHDIHLHQTGRVVDFWLPSADSMTSQASREALVNALQQGALAAGHAVVVTQVPGPATDNRLAISISLPIIQSVALRNSTAAAEPSPPCWTT